MGSYHIELPAPVIDIEVKYQPGPERNEGNTWLATVEVGGVVVMERTYDADWHSFTQRPKDFAEDPDEARQMIAKDFGLAIKKLLEG
jgi:hypothetical protein